MDMSLIREWLIANGKTPAELDLVEEPAVIRDIGEGLLLSLQNDDDIGQMLVMILIKQEAQAAEIEQLKDEIEVLKGGAA